MPETIKLSEYDENWAVCFLSEKKQLEHSFKKMCPGNLVDILHIGSTSVKGLLSKSIIDIILVVKNIGLIDNTLLDAGYHYKGEYNIPMRKMYGKHSVFKIHLHSYEEGNPEITLNYVFRCYLENNPEARAEYSLLKKSIAEKGASQTKVSTTGITVYNLSKNDFIQKILKKTGFVYETVHTASGMEGVQLHCTKIACAS